MQPAKFIIDFLEGCEFEGYTRGEDWNGFACPYFTFDQAQQIVEAWRETGYKAFYSDKNDEFSFEMQSGETDRFPSISTDGVKVYPIGNGCWIWSEVLLVDQ